MKGNKDGEELVTQPRQPGQRGGGGVARGDGPPRQSVRREMGRRKVVPRRSEETVILQDAVDETGEVTGY